MPPWGRPLGAWQGKMRKGWERQARQWEEQRRFEEVDSDSDDGQGVNLDDTFVSDELLFTGADLGRHVRGYDYSESSDDSYDRLDDHDRKGAAMQVALRDKEELLVQRALERIRRAQLLGQKDVELSQPEIDALERKRQKDQVKSRRSVLKIKSTDKRPTVGRLSSSPKASRKTSRSSLSKYIDREHAYPTANTVPSYSVAGQDGSPLYIPVGYQPPSNSPYGPASRPGSRSTSSHNLQKHSPPLIQSQHRNPKKRYFSVPEQQHTSSSSRAPPSPRPSTTDLNRSSRPRSASSIQPYALDSHQYQTYSPPVPQVPSQYARGRRVASGPPDRHSIGLSAHQYASSSDPSLLRREYSAGSRYQESTSDEDLDEDDDEDHGVQVDVRSYAQGYNVNVNSSTGRQRKGRR